MTTYHCDKCGAEVIVSHRRGVQVCFGGYDSRGEFISHAKRDRELCQQCYNGVVDAMDSLLPIQRVAPRGTP